MLTVHHARQFTGALSMLNHEASIATGRAVGANPRSENFGGDGFQNVMRACPAIASGILSVMALRRPEADALAQQREKMAALGKLSAGLAHELNNPAAAARRAAARLRESLETLAALGVPAGRTAVDRGRRKKCCWTCKARPSGLRWTHWR